MAALVASSLVVLGCGDDGAAGEVELIADLDPCSLLTPEAATELTGAAVAEAGGGLGGAIGCGYEFADEAAADTTGSAIAARLVLSPADGDGDEALAKARDAAVDEARDAGTAPEVADVTLAGAPPGAATPADDVPAVTVSSSTTVRVVYVVGEVVVEVLIVPAETAVDAAKVDQVVAFTETTVRPVKEAVVESDIALGDIEGVWTGDWGTMILEESGGSVRGVYTHDEGTIVGSFENGVIRAWWTEVPTRAPTGDAGEVEFRFTKTADGVSLDGRWRYGTDGDFSEDWDLTRTDEPSPDGLAARFDDDNAFVPHP